MLRSDPAERLARARLALDGLSIGDALGERFFTPSSVLQMLLNERALPAPPWRFTDDTQMALSLVALLRAHGEIDQDALATHFARHFDIMRGYGPAMHRLMPRIRSGIGWRVAARELFGGAGSFGNGAAMRVAPLGAYFADDLDLLITQARRSGEVTHAHPEGSAGAIAVALAAAYACAAHDAGARPSPTDFLTRIWDRVPPSEVRDGIATARDLPPNAPFAHVVHVLGNGDHVTAQDTVPFTLWCAAQHLDDYPEAVWMAIKALGDRDTTAAIVGGIVACFVGAEGIPDEWRAAREPLPEWDDAPKRRKAGKG